MNVHEKRALIFFVILRVTFVFSVKYVVDRISSEIDSAGGVKQIVITVGKEVKDIKRQIDKEDQQ